MLNLYRSVSSSEVIIMMARFVSRHHSIELPLFRAKGHYVNTGIAGTSARHWVKSAQQDTKAADPGVPE
jgi:hypothetical protein